MLKEFLAGKSQAEKDAYEKGYEAGEIFYGGDKFGAPTNPWSDVTDLALFDAWNIGFAHADKSSIFAE